MLCRNRKDRKEEIAQNSATYDASSLVPRLYLQKEPGTFYHVCDIDTTQLHGGELSWVLTHTHMFKPYFQDN